MANKEYKVRFYNHISQKIHTKASAKKLVKKLKSIYGDDCASVVEIGGVIDMHVSQIDLVVKVAKAFPKEWVLTPSTYNKMIEFIDAAIADNKVKNDGA